LREVIEYSLGGLWDLGASHRVISYNIVFVLSLVLISILFIIVITLVGNQISKLLFILS
jgi:hypothetical protein